MATTGRAEPPSNYNVRLANSAKKQAWDRLSCRPTIPTKYPDSDVLTQLGLHDDFWNLSLVEGAQQRVHSFFSGNWPTFRGYTLEFLSTLKVIKRSINRRDEVERIEFRLGNRNRVLTVEEFDAVFGTRMDEPEENLDHDTFWQMITLENRFESGKSKGSAIRNPILRLCHRSISNSIFARADAGSVNNNELFLLWSLLHGKLILLSHHIPVYWERISRNASGSICCGGHVTALCQYYNIELNADHKVLGEMYLTYDVLHQMEVIKRDKNHHAYLYQGSRGDHFPLPSPALTKINGWEYKDNWKMDTPAHQRVVAAFPARTPWQTKKRPWGGPFLDPGADVGASQTVALREEAEEEEDTPMPSGTSHRYQQRNRGNRRTREERAAEFEESVTLQLGQLHTSHDNLRNQINQQWDQQQAFWTGQQRWQEEANQRWDTQWQQHEAQHWNAMLDQDMQQTRVLQELQRENREHREEQQRANREIGERLDHMTTMMNQWNTFFSNYPPQPPPQ